MKIYIVNLKSSLERKSHMTQQLDSLGLEHEFIEAIDGREMSETERAKLTKNLNYAFLPGEIGCALSHQKIYQKMIDENIRFALILEDDVILNHDIKSLILSISPSTTTPEVILLSRVNKYYKKPKKNLTGKYSIHKTQQATTTHSYIINNIAAKSLLDNLHPVWMVADKWSLFEDLSLAKIYSVIPHPINLSEDASTSTINLKKNDVTISKKKTEIWEKLMLQRPLLAKVKHKYRRAITPIFHKIVNQGKG